MSAELDHPSEALMAQARNHLFANYKPAPIILDHGDGATVFDSEGKRYIDLVAGVAVSALGHNHAAVVEALQARLHKVLHTSNLYFNEPAAKLSISLTNAVGLERVFFCQSGTEANEAALKLARLYHHKHNTGRFEIISTLKSFHGRTMGALSATGQAKYHVGFEPLVPGFHHVEYGSFQAIEEAVDTRTAAVILEPIQGEGGVRVPPPDYLQKVRELCDKNGVLLILDEVQTGVGRTGQFLAAHGAKIRADITTLAKGLAAGLPLGAMLAREEVAQVMIPGTHASTFGGNPFSCAAAQVVVEHVGKEDFLAQVRARGALARRLLEGVCQRVPGCVEVRGQGLLLGLELAKQAEGFVDKARQNGVLANVIGDRVLRVAPPLVITDAELTEGIQAIEKTLFETTSK